MRNGDYYEVALSGRTPHLLEPTKMDDALWSTLKACALPILFAVRPDRLLHDQQRGNVSVVHRTKVESGKLRIAFMDTDWLDHCEHTCRTRR